MYSHVRFLRMHKTQVQHFWRMVGADTPLLVEHWQELSSTNDRAAELCRTERYPVLVIADHQTDGRGRHKRTWHDSPGESLLMSVGFPYRWFSSIEPIILQAASALAALEELRCYTPQDSIRLKYPNDIFARQPGKPAGKMAGILIESDYLGGQRQSSVVGIGINFTGAPTSMGTEPVLYCLAHIASVLLPSPDYIAVSITERLIWLLDNGTNAQIFQRWRSELQLEGRCVILRSQQEKVRVVTMKANGSLVVLRLDTNQQFVVTEANSLLYDPFSEV